MLYRNRRHSSQAGMSLIELMVAGIVLVVGFAGVMALMMNAVASNGRNKKDTSANSLAQMVLERIETLPEGTTTTTTVTDCAGNNFTINSAAGGANLIGGATGGAIDYSQAYAGVPANYKMQYVVCDAVGRQTTYDVRWNVTAGAGSISHTTYVTIGARPLGAASGNLRFFALPVNFRALVGQ